MKGERRCASCFIADEFPRHYFLLRFGLDQVTQVSSAAAAAASAPRGLNQAVEEIT
jgi:hypothetical protein